MGKILVVGGGASGMIAAIQAASNKNQVTIYECTDRVGKKILATGNGKCNLTNLAMGVEYYYTTDTKKLERCLERFSEKDTMDFFEGIGLLLRERDGYVYPYCEQAAVVLDVLRNALGQKEICVKTSVENIRITPISNNRFEVVSSVGKVIYDAVILACGSKAGIKNAITSGYDLAKSFGHKIIKLYPALVQVRCKEKFFAMIAGVRCKAALNVIVNGISVAKEQGEVQLTDYGISGIPVFQISRLVAGELDKKENVEVELDFLPHQTKEDWKRFCDSRIKQYEGKTAEEFLLGILHKKLSLMLLKEFGLKPTDLVSEKTSKILLRICCAMKSFIVTPTAVNPFEQAQVCRGGVAFGELDDNMQSIYQKNLYICGEMVDIDGKCGGYNLQWAWTSGSIAGKNAGK